MGITNKNKKIGNYYKVFDDRNRLVLVTPSRRSAGDKCEELLGYKPDSINFDRLNYGCFRIERFVQKQNKGIFKNSYRPEEY